MPPRPNTHSHPSSSKPSTSTPTSAPIPNVITRHQAKVSQRAHQAYLSYSSGIDGTLHESSSSSTTSYSTTIRATRKRTSEDTTHKAPAKQPRTSKQSTTAPTTRTRATRSSSSKTITAYLRPSKMSTSQKRSSLTKSTDAPDPSHLANDPSDASKGALISDPSNSSSDQANAMDVDDEKGTTQEKTDEKVEGKDEVEGEDGEGGENIAEHADDDDENEDDEHDEHDETNEHDEHDDDEEDEDDDEDEYDQAHNPSHLDEGLFSSSMSGIVSGTSSRLKSILTNLRAYEDPSLQLIALQDLAFLLSVSTEDSLAGYISCDSFVKELVILMRGTGDGDDNPDTMLLACRCLSNLMEAMPAALGSVVYGGAVPVLCAKLIEIQYIDVAEQSLTALEKISSEYPNAVVKEGGLAAVLMFLDFFSTNVQRTAVKTAANCCRGMQHDNITMVKDILPNLESILQYSDQKIVEQVCLCFVRLADSFKSNAAHLQSIITENVLRSILSLLSPHASVIVGPSIYTLLLRFLSTVAEHSPVLGFALLEMDVVDTLFLVLTGTHAPDTFAEGAKVSNVGSRSKDQVLEILGTISELLPPLPRDNALFDTEYRHVAPQAKDQESPSSSDVEMKQATTEGPEKRQELLAAHPERVHRLAKVLIPTLIEVYSSTVHLKVRQRAIHALVKLVYFAGDEQLKSVLKDVELASFLAVILSQQEHQSLVVAALQISHILMTKLPSTYRVYFEREGVLFEISKLAYLGAELSLTKDQSKLRKQEPKVLAPSTETTASTTSVSTSAPTSTSTNSTEVNITEEQSAAPDANDSQVDDDPFSEANMGQRLLGLVTELRNMRERRGQPSTDEQLNAIQGELAKAFTKIASTPGDEPSSEGESHSTRQHLRILQRLMGNGSRSVITAHKEERGLGSGKAKDWIFERASIIVELCEDQRDSAESSGDAKSALAGLQRVAAGFKGSPDAASASLKELASYFSEKGTSGISSFEFLNSGLPQSLLDYLTAPPVLSNSTAQAQRYRAFVETFMVPSNAGAKISPFSLLVKKMQEALTRTESFEVEAAQNSRGDVQGNPSSSLATQLRLKIAPEEGTEVPSTYQNLHVSIHAIATFRTLDEYLRPRLKPKLTTPEKVTTLNPVKGDQKSIENESEEKSGTVTRKSRRLQKVAAPPTPDDTEKMPEAGKEEVEAHDDEEHDEEQEEQDDDSEELDHENIEDMEYERDLKLAGASPVDVDSDIKMTDATGGDGGAKKPRSSKTASSKSDDRASSSPWHIQFSLYGVPISTDMTVYGAIHEYERKHGKSAAQRSGWPTTYPITYKRVDTVAPEQTPLSSQSQRSSIVDSTFTADIPKELAQQSDLSPLLCLLRVLHGLNDDWRRFYGSETPQTVHHLEPKEFVNSKITAKVNRQLEEPLIVASACLPQWTVGLVTGFPFLFPFETRYTYLQSTSFGFSRSIMRWQNQQQRNGQTDHRDDSHMFLGRIQRQKVRISRHKALESAVRVMELYGSSQTMLEVEYYEEVGTGLGPTLEFYSVVSREFCKKSLKLWRDSDPESKTEYVTTPYNLFPRPLAHLKGHANESKILNLFKSLGQFIAKAMLDSRIIDVPLSGLLVSRLLGRHQESHLSLVFMIDPVLAKSLESLQTFVSEKKKIYALNLPNKERESALTSIECQGAKLDDMSLDFTLPGYPEIELKAGGSDIPVTIYNVEEYISLVVDMTVGQGVEAQVAAFKSGFNCVFDIQNLAGFRSEELVNLFGSGDEDWSYETLADTIKADHGFRPESRAFKNLLNVMSGFNKEERRQFLQFITGSPKLPIGGFKNLHPAFTVVCKPYEAPLKADDYLPSVMTCANYLKMPDYSSKEVMLAKFKTAYEEGQGSFHLS
ncbi:Ubiquitin fusion degradation protein 4 [Podila epicladia]|nr:Ubiquitin fusion degradation protein 4 [Podila epicladia]